jgi:hypothetical protein
MKKIGLITIIIFSLFLFCFCQKKLFKHVEIHGRVLNYITKQPVMMQVQLRCRERGSGSSYTQGRYIMATTWPNTDGTFYIKSGAAKEGGGYYLEVEDKPALWERITLVEGKNNDLGDILVGNYTFYCKVTLVPVTNSSIDIINRDGGNDTHFNSGTSTLYLSHENKIKDKYNQNPNYTVEYYVNDPSGTRTYKSVSVPSPNGDTLNAVINY